MEKAKLIVLKTTIKKYSETTVIYKTDGVRCFFYPQNHLWFGVETYTGITLEHSLVSDLNLNTSPD